MRVISVASFRFVVRGRVQGVGYRYFARRSAQAHGLSGFARNLPDGSVEVVAEGGEDALGRLEQALREGPAFAAVDSCERSPAAARGVPGFDIR
jgi:acylphosphatase